MPKQKPVKGLVKRVKITKNGKILAKGCGSSHRRVVKSAKQKRRLGQVRPVHPTAAKIIMNQLGR